MLKLIYSAVIAVSLIAIPMSGQAQEVEGKIRNLEVHSQEQDHDHAPAAKREPTPGQLAARERQKQCGVEWKEAKAAGKTKGTTWPKFWSACNKRLKEKNT